MKSRAWDRRSFERWRSQHSLPVLSLNTVLTHGRVKSQDECVCCDHIKCALMYLFFGIMCSVFIIRLRWHHCSSPPTVNCGSGVMYVFNRLVKDRHELKCESVKAPVEIASLPVVLPAVAFVNIFKWNPKSKHILKPSAGCTSPLSWKSFGADDVSVWSPASGSRRSAECCFGAGSNYVI